MTEKWKRKWLEALRGGGYEQTRFVLQANAGGSESYCCLGVLCDISEVGHWSHCAYVTDSFTSDMADLPDSVKRRTRLKNSEVRTLAAMNDAGAAFPEIADYIEANL